MAKRISWRNIKGTDYRVSSVGQVRHKSHLNRDGKPVYGDLMSQRDNSSGYFRVNLVINNEHKSKFVHRLVAEAFLPKIEGKNYVNHKDGVKHNNNVENLEWCSFQENIDHAWKNGIYTIHDGMTGENHPMHKLSQEEVDWIRANHIPYDAEFGSIPLSKKFNVTDQTITDIVHGRTWK